MTYYCKRYKVFLTLLGFYWGVLFWFSNHVPKLLLWIKFGSGLVSCWFGSQCLLWMVGMLLSGPLCFPLHDVCWVCSWLLFWWFIFMWNHFAWVCLSVLPFILLYHLSVSRWDWCVSSQCSIKLSCWIMIGSHVNISLVCIGFQ